jgi:hypothetical protein
MVGGVLRNALGINIYEKEGKKALSGRGVKLQFLTTKASATHQEIRSCDGPSKLSLLWEEVQAVVPHMDQWIWMPRAEVEEMEDVTLLPRQSL